jgi:hypothetical protein
MSTLQRDYQLESCLKCHRRKFNTKKGVVCGLTDEWAEFDLACDNFLLDAKAEIQLIREKEDRLKDSAATDTMGLNQIGITNGILAGIIITSIAIVAMITGFVFGIFRIYASFALVVGLVVLVKGILDRRKKINKKIESTDLLDQ